MLKPVMTRFLQHICAQNAWARPHLIPHASKTIRFDFVFAKANLMILEDGSLGMSGEITSPEASIHAPPSLMLRILANDEAAKKELRIEGDTALAADFAKVLQHMRWDYADDLSRVVGDIPAEKITAFAQKSASTAKQQITNLADMLAEYWQEEVPILAKKRQVDAFNTSVDTLVGDVERLEKRLEKLAKKHVQDNVH